MRLFFALAALLAACSPAANTATDGEVTFYGDVEPITQRVCASCHTTGGIGPGDFTTYEGIAAWAELVAHEVAAGEMPPKVSDPDCRPYSGSDHLTITDAEREAILAWVDAGAPAGDPEEALPPFEPELESLDDADRVLELPETYTLQPDASGNEYRCFVVDWSPEETTFVSGFDVQIDNPEVVHHMLLFRDPNNDAGSGYGAEPGATSFDCMDPIMESDWEPLHAWAPGMPPTVLGDDMGLKLERGDQIVIQMHYYAPAGAGETDRSAYALRTSTDSMREVMMFPGAMQGFQIPAGEESHTYTERIGLGFLPFAVEIHGVFPHMHLLGTHYEAQIEADDGSEECVVRGEWDFDHQMSYMFEEPVRLEPSDTLVGSCTWDNSADNPDQPHDPPRDITWGEGTDEEMCVFLSYVSVAQ